MNYLLDTNAAVALLRGKPGDVREHYRQAVADGDYIAVSSVALFELWYGVQKSTRIAENRERLQIFLSGAVDLVSFDDEDAQTAGQVRVALEKSGTPIGAYDLLIAGQALQRGLTVVTANTSDFARVNGLSWVDWSV